MVALRHVIVTGQSLAIGSMGAPAVSPSTQPNTHLHRINSDGSLTALTNGSGRQWPERTLAERAWSSDPFDLTVNTSGLGGTSYAGVKKGTATYAAAIALVQAGFDAAVARGDTFEARAVHFVHGEEDKTIGTSRATYLADLNEWLSDYSADVKAITGQAFNLLGLLCQLGSSATGQIGPAQLDAHRQHNGLTLVTPKYHLPYADSLHLTPLGYYRLGEYHGRAHREAVINGGNWEPLSPTSITIRGAEVIVAFSVLPSAPLVFDTSAVPAQTAMGFSVADSSGNVPISDVAIHGTAVVLTLGRTTTGTVTVSYGANNTRGQGNLRDSDPAVSASDGAQLANWCVQFSDVASLAYAPPSLDAGRPRSASGPKSKWLVSYSGTPVEARARLA